MRAIRPHPSGYAPTLITMLCIPTMLLAHFWQVAAIPSGICQRKAPGIGVFPCADVPKPIIFTP